MSLLTTLLYLVFILSALVLVVVILLQEGKGGGFGDALGAAGQQTFGVKASGIHKFTSGVAVLFFVTAITIHITTRIQAGGTGLDELNLEAPAIPGSSAHPGDPGTDGRRRVAVPMIRSMTGFGAATVGEEGATARVELRSTNHRHLQAKVRLPHDFNSLEPELEAVLRKRFARGSMTAHVSVELPARMDAVQIDRELARRYHTLLQELSQELGTGSEVNSVEVVQMPGVLSGIQESKPGEAEAALVRKAFQGAADALDAMRASEGERLEGNLREHGRAIRSVVDRIEERMPQVVKEHHEALRSRVQELLGEQATLAPADLARELALMADRLDVREETDRLDSHLKELEAQLDKGGAVGRQLDFLAQEFLREANTIGSKCSDASVAHDVVELKTHIERLREQVQNVE